MGNLSVDRTDDPSRIILQSLICMLREKNILSRADIEDLCEKVAMRASAAERDPLPCSAKAAAEAADEMLQIGEFVGQLYGGKHLRR